MEAESALSAQLLVGLPEQLGRHLILDKRLLLIRLHRNWS